jgi:hypothetical protein
MRIIYNPTISLPMSRAPTSISRISKLSSKWDKIRGKIIPDKAKSTTLMMDVKSKLNWMTMHLNITN